MFKYLRKGKLTLSTMKAARAVFMEQGGDVCEVYLIASGCSKKHARQWVDEFAKQACKNVRK